MAARASSTVMLATGFSMVDGLGTGGEAVTKGGKGERGTGWV